MGSPTAASHHRGVTTLPLSLGASRSRACAEYRGVGAGLAGMADVSDVATLNLDLVGEVVQDPDEVGKGVRLHLNGEVVSSMRIGHQFFARRRASPSAKLPQATVTC